MSPRDSKLVRNEAFIGGQWVPASDEKQFDVIDPANGAVLASVADCTLQDAEAAIMAEQAAFARWKELPGKERGLDLSRYEQPREQEDDFRQRMLANVAAFAFTVALTAVGIWLAMSIADLRRTQDCVLMGRRDCVHISTP